MQIVSAYSTLANGGYKIDPYLIDRIEAVDGSLLFQARPNTVCRDCEKPSSEEGAPETEFATLEEVLNNAQEKDDLNNDLKPSLSEEELESEQERPEAERVIEPRVAYIIDSIMRDVIQKGTGRKARSLNRNDVAGKTGTTNGPTDAWFSGYSGGIVTTAWLGFDKNNVLGRREYGGSAALPIWIDYMETALQDRPISRQKQPQGLVTVKIDPKTGLLAKPGQRDTLFEVFREEFAPREQSSQGAVGIEDSPTDNILEEDLF